MRSIKVIGSFLVLAFATCSIAAAAASAAFPEFGSCKKLGMLTGKWTDSKCTMENPELKGLFEFTPLSSSTEFETGEASIGEVFLELGGTRSVTCEEGSNKGKTSAGQNSTHVKMVIKLFRCTAKAGAEECTTPGASAGEIVFKEFKSWLIYVEKKPRATKKAGLFVEPETGLFTEWKCGLGSTVKVLKNNTMISNRCLAGEITPINEAVENLSQTFSIFEKKQVIKEFEYLGFTVKCQLEAEVEPGKIENLNVRFVNPIIWLPHLTKIEVKS